MTPLISAMQVTLDGSLRDADGRADWVDSWADGLELLPPVSAFVLGGGMFPEYEQFWAAVRDGTAAELLGREPYPRELAYARRAAETPHLVLSRTLTETSWPSARIVRDLADITELKRRPGEAVYVVGGPTLVSSLIDAGLLDELRLIVHPVAVGNPEPLFPGRHALELVSAEPMTGGRISLVYRLAAMPLLWLGTTGAQSGEARATPLAYRRDGDRLYVIASNGGAAAEPAWYRNLRATPAVSVEVGDERFEATATVLEGDERERVFAAIVRASPAAGEYEARSGRATPVVALDRA
jgi:deazaflavin-dependent oxidoreductase (nitroreductase family)